MNKTFFVTLIIILVISASILFWSLNKPSFISSIISSTVSSIGSFLSYSPVTTQTLTYPSDKWERFWYVKSTGVYLGSDPPQTSPTFDDDWFTGIVTYKGGCSGADINQDGRVDGSDLALFGGFWNKNCTSPDWCNNVDMNKDGIVDGSDLALFGGNNGRTDCGWKDDIMFSSSRTINFPTAGAYTFTVGSNDGVRLWVDDVLKIDKWVDRSYTTNSVTLNNLTAGNHRFRIDWYENEEAARVSFNYSQAITPPSLTYPSDRWERFWYVRSTGVYLGSDQDQTLPTFNNDWSTGIVTHKGGCSGADINQDGRVDGSDLALFGGFWNKNCTSPDWCNNVDMNKDGIVDGSDLALFGGNNGRTDCGWKDDIMFSSSRTINFPTAGTYTFTVGSDDGVKLWVDGDVRIDKWVDRPYTTNSINLTLTAGNHTFRLDWYESGGGALVSFNYSQVITPPSLTYPSDKWERFWYVRSTGVYLGSDPSQTSPTFNNDWSLGVVAYNRADDIMFSSSRTINFPTAGTYTFTVGSDDGVKLWVDGDVRIDKWVDRPYTTNSINLTLTAGNHRFRIDWYENEEAARVSFNYLINTCSDGTPYGSCSSTKPKSCQNGTLVDKCSSCGCNSSYTCDLVTNTCKISTIYISPNGNDSNQGTFESPFLTLERAKAKIREEKTKGLTKPINVYLRGGTYYLDKTFELNAEDSGSLGKEITYQSYPGEIAYISGGKKIEGGWTSVGNGIYKINVGQLKFRQFYVNGQEASRARTNYYNMTLFEYKRNPDGTIKKVAGTNYDELTGRIIVKKEDVSNWVNLNTANLPEMHAQQKWFQHIFRIKSISYDVNPLDADPSKNVILNLAEPEATIIQSYYDRANSWAPTLYFFENAFEFLNEKGEWFLSNSGDLYYMPRDGESIKSSEFVVPVLEKLLILEGKNNDETINFVNFKNLVFEYSNWIKPSEFGFLGEQAGFYVLEWYWRNPKQPPAAISVRKAKNILFYGCEFRNLGGNGISFEKGVHNSIVNHSEFNNIASTAFLIDGDTNMSWYTVKPPDDRRDICSNNMITNSRILNFGKNYFGAVGIFAPFVENTTITNNEIAYGPYDGIHFGWGWTANHKLTKNATISRNHIHHTMQELSDGGQIYILGNLINITVSENYIHDTGCSLYSYLNNAHAGIYLDGVGLRDETSGGWIIPPDVLVKDNIAIRAANCPGWSDPFWLWYAKSGSSGHYETTSGHEDIIKNAGPKN